MDDEAFSLYNHAFNANMSLLPKGSVTFGRALATTAADVNDISPVVSAQWKAALAMLQNGSVCDDGPRSARTHGLHLHGACSCGLTPVRGALYRSADADICRTCYAALPDDDARDAFEEVEPDAYRKAPASDDDDGHLCLVLPGTRRAIALLVRSAQQAGFAQAGVNWNELEEGLINTTEGDADFLCEYIELCTAVEVIDGRFHADVELALNCACRRAARRRAARADRLARYPQPTCVCAPTRRLHGR